MLTDYVVARVHGLRGRLLGAATLEALEAIPDLSQLTAALRRTDYGPELDEWQHQLDGLALLDEAIRRNVVQRMGDLARVVTHDRADQASSMPPLVQVIFGRGDVVSLVAIVRGKAAEVSPAEIEGALLPGGQLSLDQLEQLAELPDVGGIVARLNGWGVPYAAALGESIAGAASAAGLPGLEVAVWQGFLEWAATVVRGGGTDAAIVREALVLDIDATNLLSVLRVVHRGAQARWPAADGGLLPGGSIRSAELHAALAAPTVALALASLRPGPLARALSAASALASAAAVDLAIAMHASVDAYVVRWAKAQLLRDRLGVASVVAYHTAKLAEARALRLLVRGVAVGWPRDRMRCLVNTSVGA